MDVRTGDYSAAAEADDIIVDTLSIQHLVDLLPSACTSEVDDDMKVLIKEVRYPKLASHGGRFSLSLSRYIFFCLRGLFFFHRVTPAGER